MTIPRNDFLPPAYVRCICTTALALSCMASWSADLDRVNKPSWQVGDSWNYNVVRHPHFENPATVRTYESYAVRSVATSFYMLEHATKDAGDNTRTERQRWSNSLNFVNRNTTNDKLQERTFYKWPIVVGATWEFPFHVPNLGDTISRMTVFGWETVTVPAGTFRAIRVDLAWSGFFFQYSAGRQASIWYAPEVKNQVKSETYVYARTVLASHHTSELASFHLSDAGANATATTPHALAANESTRNATATPRSSPTATATEKAASTSRYNGVWLVSRACAAREGLPAMSGQWRVAVRTGEFLLETGTRGQPGYSRVSGRPSEDGTLALDGVLVSRAQAHLGEEVPVYFEGELTGDRFVLKGRYGSRDCSLTMARLSD